MLCFLYIKKQRMCLGTFSRLRRSLATSTLYAAVRIPAERFSLYRKAISCKVKKQSGVIPGCLILNNYRLSIHDQSLRLIIYSISLSISDFSYATISSSGISPFEKIFARDTYCDSLDFRFSLSPSPVTSSTLPSQLSTTSKIYQYL